MNQVKTGAKYQSGAPVYQEIGHSQIGFFPGPSVNFQHERTQNLPPVCMTSMPPPPLWSCAPQCYGEAMNMAQHYYMTPQPVGFPQGGLVKFLPEGAQNLASMTTTSTQTPQPPARTLVHNKKAMEEQMNGRTFPGHSADSTACQLRNTSSSLPQEVAGASARSSLKPPDTLLKRELRLMKNREAARECRRKKKEYVKCLENRVAVLENQNKTLIEELRALKDIYRHKAE
ncbi:cAMP-responsive element modulator-like isoform X2 [Cebidichthys violaceus]|uniref:cAMP-responsive element modulator-like isoform X2 n=1 Tax=Cebidichthys violaceus TaxID=271503 RepID=UPI0035CC89F2